eukprot:TRINITY_DN5381_c1_g2_i1.p1 TRINITY_DN5381_c1_g2~~TRINITY_DN5381_c1_g2_i1.p1  ORF type:complete len:238 (+),score=32.88 TRINITY_DN5381_c1_g2_i1:71-715(+)
MMVMEDGSVYACGDNLEGELGLGDTANRSKLEQVALPRGMHARHVQCGMFCTMAVMGDGSVYSCGENDHGGLGLGDDEKRFKFERVMLPEGKRVRDMRCGGGHTMMVMDDKSVYACGNNEYGQLGLGDEVWDVVTTLTRVMLPDGKSIRRIYQRGVWSTSTHAMCAPKVQASVEAVMCAWWTRMEDGRELGALPVEVLLNMLAMVEFDSMHYDS